MALISDKMNKAMNDQIKEELDSGYLYLQMSIWLDEHNFKNLAKWYDIQAKEEYEHAEKFIHYIVETGGKVELLPLSKPKSDWKSIKEIIDAGLAHEKHITSKIESLVRFAEELGELQPRSMLMWFIDEQIEEEANAQALIDTYAGFKNDQLFDHHTHRDED
ncbi:MAG: ferritin [Candidatus Heimdallarchaeota archaeon]|nr:ferritin [Candidatus Heimdallarchaeota archaeon]